MLIDARELPAGETIEADLAIIGGGVAGITIARALIDQDLVDRGLRVVLLESGGLDYDPPTQALYEGRVVGHPSIALDLSRLRFFGGTSNHWAGYCRPLDPIDFETRPWVPHSGWPLGRADLDPWYERAQPVLELGAFDYRPSHWRGQMAPLFTSQVMEERLAPAVFQQSPPTNLGLTYREPLEKADNVRLFLWANVIEIVAAEDAGSIESLSCACLEGSRFSVKASAYVLATGGIENARLLLASNSIAAAGLGNEHDLVGRYFMDHPATQAATILLSSPSSIARAPAGQVIDTQCTLTSEVEREGELLRFLTTLTPLHDPGGQAPGYVALRTITKSLRRGRWPEDFWAHVGAVAGDLDGAAGDLYDRFFGEAGMLTLRIHPEVAPNPESRVTLIAGERDALGMPRVRLDWRITDLDRRSIRRGLEIIGEEFGRAGLGRLRFEDWVLEEGFVVPGNGSYHHIGTTRMADDPKRGVVDRDCKVHGLSNLWIAGSSVFPTEGFANPTLTITALALRLTEHLRTTRFA